MHEDERTLEAYQILRKQLPLLTERLQITLDKLSAPTLETSESIALKSWWQELQSKYAGRDINFTESIHADPTIPLEVFNTVTENLLENALRYTPVDGCISIKLSHASNQIQVRVADTGCGIPPEELPHIFDRFYRLEKNRTTSDKNAGLGLAIVKRIIDLHGSTISADSTPTVGTTFQFALHTSH